MSFQVDTHLVRKQSRMWQQWAGHATDVRSDIAPAVGQGYKFGFKAEAEGVSERYDEWVSEMDQALLDAHRAFHWLSTALESVAATYDHSDATTATGMKKLDAMIDSHHAHEPPKPLPERLGQIGHLLGDVF